MKLTLGREYELYPGTGDALVVFFSGGATPVSVMQSLVGGIRPFGGASVAWPHTAKIRLGAEMLSWNADDGLGLCGEAAKRDILDLSFAEELIEDAAQHCAFDRVIAAGVSNGGVMAYRLGHAGIVDGVACVAGGSPVLGARGGKQVLMLPWPRPIPVLHIHGMRDTTWAWDGSTVVETGNDFKPWAVEAAVAEVAKWNGDSGFVERTFIGGWSRTWGKTKLMAKKLGGHNWFSSSPDCTDEITKYFEL